MHRDIQSLTYPHSLFTVTSIHIRLSHYHWNEDLVDTNQSIHSTATVLRAAASPHCRDSSPAQDWEEQSPHLSQSPTRTRAERGSKLGQASGAASPRRLHPPVHRLRTDRQSHWTTTPGGRSITSPGSRQKSCTPRLHSTSLPTEELSAVLATGGFVLDYDSRRKEHYLSREQTEVLHSTTPLHVFSTEELSAVLAAGGLVGEQPIGDRSQ